MVIIGKIFNERLTLQTLNLEYYLQEFTSYFKKQAGKQTKQTKNKVSILTSKFLPVNFPSGIFWKKRLWNNFSQPKITF